MDCYRPDIGAPAKAVRLMAGLQYLKYAFDESDESVVARWVENPYWQYFCGYTHMQHECPIHPTSMTKWRNRVGAERLEALLTETIDYSLHEPEVQCISKGKAHKRYEFGQKISLATTNRSNWIVASALMEGNPYDGHTLTETLTTVERVTGVTVADAYVDKGYRGHGYAGGAEVHIAGQRRKNTTRAERKRGRRRSAIEPKIGHLKNDQPQSGFAVGWVGASWRGLPAMRSTSCWLRRVQLEETTGTHPPSGRPVCFCAR